MLKWFCCARAMVGTWGRCWRGVLFLFRITCTVTVKQCNNVVLYIIWKYNSKIHTNIYIYLKIKWDSRVHASFMLLLWIVSCASSSGWQYLAHPSYNSVLESKIRCFGIPSHGRLCKSTGLQVILYCIARSEKSRLE